MSNTRIYDEVRSVPQEAQKEIEGGRLKGMTDINPQWRIRTLTEQFGPCGLGWTYEITDKRLEHAPDGQAAAFVDINLYFKANGEWSIGIPGTGGSTFIKQESSSMYMSDECFKMALTDAISVACKALGFGADIYWSKGATKYQQDVEGLQEVDMSQHEVPFAKEEPTQTGIDEQKATVDQINTIKQLAKDNNVDLGLIYDQEGLFSLDELGLIQARKVIKYLQEDKSTAPKEEPPRRGDVSPQQVKYMNVLVGKLGWDKAAFRDWLTKNYQVESATELSKRDASKAIDTMVQLQESQPAQ